MGSVPTPPSPKKMKPAMAPEVARKISKSRVNWNPMSAAGRLDELAFMVTLLLLVAVSIFSMVLIEKPLLEARQRVDFPIATRFYGIWFFLSICVFWMVTSTFVKRWNKILGVE